MHERDELRALKREIKMSRERKVKKRIYVYGKEKKRKEKKRTKRKEENKIKERKKEEW
jgi:hypothetical protein